MTAGALLACCLLSSVAFAEPAPVTVRLTEPDRFTDFGDRCSERAPRGLHDELTAFLRDLAAPHVAPGASLAITVLDVDMAGEFESWRGPQFCDTRVLREIHAPRIRLSFRLIDAQGQVLRTGTRDLRDLNYLSRAGLVAHDRLRYEKELLRDWVRDELAATR